MSEQQQYQGQMTSNAGYEAPTVIQFRLDTEPITAKMEYYLRGQTIRYEPDENGDPKLVTFQTGKKKCNEEGIQAILAFVTSLINSQTVQGNYTREEYDNYIFEANVALALMVVDSVNDWQISESDTEPIINYIMLLIIPFFSRLIDNKERDSYSVTMKSNEVNTISPKNSGFGFLSK